MAIADHTPAARQAGSAQDGARTGAPAVRHVWALARLSLGFLNDHLIYALLIIGLALTGAGNALGLGRWWAGTRLVERFPVLR
jgi:hypothetical protein